MMAVLHVSHCHSPSLQLFEGGSGGKTGSARYLENLVVEINLFLEYFVWIMNQFCSIWL